MSRFVWLTTICIWCMVMVTTTNGDDLLFNASLMSKFLLPFKTGDPVINKMAEFATTQIANTTNSRNLQLIRVIQAKILVYPDRLDSNHLIDYYLTLDLKGANDDDIRICNCIIGLDEEKKRKFTFESCKSVELAPTHLMQADAPAVYSRLPPTNGVNQFTAINTEMPLVKRLANMSIAHLSNSSKAANQYKLVKIVKAETQDLRGKNYIISMKLSDPFVEKFDCQVVIFDHENENVARILQLVCPSKGTSKSTPYLSSSPANATSVDETMSLGFQSGNYKYKEMVECTLAFLNRKSRATDPDSLPYEIVEIVEGEEQIYTANSDQTYRMTLTVLHGANPQPLTCDVALTKIPWSENYRIFSNSCLTPAIMTAGSG